MSDTLTPDIETQESYGKINADQRIDLLREILEDTQRVWKGGTTHGDYYVQRANPTDSYSAPHYLHIRHANTPTAGIRFGKLIYDTGDFKDETDPKIHLNVSVDRLLEVVEVLAEIQNQLVEKSPIQNKTFLFKVAVDDKAFGEEKPAEGWPPRIVIYPSTHGLYPNGREGQFNDTYLTEIVNMIEQGLEKINDWKDPTYRARYHKKLESFSKADGGIEVVQGHTVNQGDNS